MEIAQLRKEITLLLENVVDHSKKYDSGRQIPSLEIGVVLAKVNKLQENLVVLKHLLQQQEKSSKKRVIHREKEDSAIANSIKNAALEESLTPINSEKNSPITETSQQTKTRNIADTFSLNDRYLYANELFNKDMEAFNNCIKSINNCSSLDEVTKKLNDAKGQFNWNEENEHFTSFVNTINNRFL